MPARYTVVQYVPDAIADERINIGVIAFTEDRVLPQFLQDWSRVRKFGGSDVEFLKGFARELKQSASPTIFLEGFAVGGGALTAATIMAASGAWTNNIRFTEPRASLRTVEDVLTEMSARFLSEPLHKRRGARDRRHARLIVVRHIRHGLELRMGEEADALVRTRKQIEGLLQAHRFDAVVANGIPYFAAQALSFEMPDADRLKRDVDATAWQLSDVHAFNPALPLAVLALPPRPQYGDADRAAVVYEEGTKVFRQLKAEVLGEDEVEAWATRQSQRLPLSALP